MSEPRTQDDDVTPNDLETLRSQLGRVPRGVVGIAARCAVCGRPLVVRTAPRLDDGSPFPTSFYLTSPPVVKAVSTCEATGAMEEMNRRLSADGALREQYAAAHEDYLRHRAQLGEVPEIAGVSAGGMPSRVKCLHALVGHALAVGPGVNPFGDEVIDRMEAEGVWSRRTCSCV